MDVSSAPALRIAVVGSGVSGLSAAWLLSARHDVTLFEQTDRLGGHANTVVVDGPQGQIEVDTGFIVYNHQTYPNLVALFDCLGIDSYETEMSFSVSRHAGGLEYAGTSVAALFAQPANIVRPGFWAMLLELRRFYANAPRDLPELAVRPLSLGEYLDLRKYGAQFRNDHLLPMAAAIWSAPPATMLDYPAASFIRFYENHGLLKLHARPAWHTVVGGSKVYVQKLAQRLGGNIRSGNKVVGVARDARGAVVRTADGRAERFDHVVVATHADEALALLGDATDKERRLLGAFRYSNNRAFLHTDSRLMPRRRGVWSSWNYVESRDGAYVTYWMNRLQRIPAAPPLFVTLNPSRPPEQASVVTVAEYAHPIFDGKAVEAQKHLWSLQGERNTWFCGAYFGSGFHEDGLQAGLAVAEDLGGVKRPWSVENDSGRIVRGSRVTPLVREAVS
jgi:predicted NAD/FAD-binding protein